jgi:hypothetical protein
MSKLSLFFNTYIVCESLGELGELGELGDLGQAALVSLERPPSNARMTAFCQAALMFFAIFYLQFSWRGHFLAEQTPVFQAPR